MKTWSPYAAGARDGKSAADYVSGLAFHHDGTKFIAIGSLTHIWDLPDWKLVKGPPSAPKLFGHEVANGGRSPFPRYPRLIDDTNQLLVVGHGLQLLDIGTRAPAKGYYYDQAMKNAALSPDGTTVAVMYKSYPTLRTLSLSAGKETPSQGQDRGLRNITWVTYSPKGDLILTGSYERDNPDGGVRIWDATTVTFQQRIEGTPKRVTCLAFSADGKLLAVGSDTGHIQLWDFEQLKLRATLESGESGIREMAFSADGLLLAAANEASVTTIWTAADADTIAAAGALLDAPSPGGSLFEEREWTDNTGSNKITATLIGIEGEAVTLRRNDTKTFTLPLSRLSQQDQELIRQHGRGSADAPSQADESSSNPVLFAEREWTQRNASSKFRGAFVGMKGAVVTIKRADGATLKLRLIWFSQEDQDFIREHWNGASRAPSQ